MAAAPSVPVLARGEARGEACGKVILLGEHFVVPHAGGADAPAIALPLPSVRCEVEAALAPAASCQALDRPAPLREAVEARMAEAIAAAAAALRIEAPLRVRSRTTVPLARGFGSSASFAVALVRALAALAQPAPRDLAAITHAVETVFHGTPSGLDTAVILAGRGVRFHRGRVERFVAAPGVALVAVDSGPRDGAAPLIARVKELRIREPAAFGRLAARMTELVDRAEAALEAGEAAEVGAIASEAHGILAELCLTTPRVEAILAAARDLGALGGKVSGAGAGGAVVLVARPGDGARLASDLAATGIGVVAISP